MSSEPVQQLLGEAQAIFESGKGTKAELARYLGKRACNVQEWFTGKAKKQPTGNTALMIQQWVKEKKRLKVKRAAFLPSTGTHIHE